MMVAPFVKRSVSLLEAEPLSILPEDELFEGSDDEISGNEQRRKRRRIEDLGRKYLEGKPLFILSAGLKGPLQPGWINPWRKKKDENHVSEIQKQHTSRPSPARGSVATASEIFDGNIGKTGLKSAHLPLPDVRHSTDLLSPDQNYLGESVKANSEAPNPTPSPRAVQQANPTAATAQFLEKSQSPTERHTSRFTPINKQVRAHAAVPRSASPHFTDNQQKRSFIEPPDSHHDAILLQQPSLHRENEFDNANDPMKEHYMNAKDLGQKAFELATAKTRCSHAHAIAQSSAVEASLPAPNSRTFHNGEDLAADQSKIDNEQLVDFQDESTRKKPKTPPEKTATDRGSFAQQLRASKAKVTAKRLSFTPFGGIKSLDSRPNSRASSASSAGYRRVDHASTQSLEKRLKNESSHEANGPSRTSAQAGPSDIFPQGPEAQLVSAPPGQVGTSAAPSGPSTNILETAHCTDEGDSYLDLSTQAAIAKAQRAFQIEIVPSLHASPRLIGNAASQLSPTAVKTPGAVPSSRLKKTLPDPITPTAEVLNTQAMLEPISPFAVTTIKKPISPAKLEKASKRTSFATPQIPSPSHTFGAARRSLSMSTSSDDSSPSPAPQPPKAVAESKPTPMLSRASTVASKPISTATSTAFSIAPNGTLTEVYQQDGQQPIDAAMGAGMEMEDWDIDEAIQEADSFLGTWNIELEARNQANAVPSGSGG